MERLALKDDWTSTGGRVIGGSSNWFAEDGRPFALADDKASCGNCKGAWPIAGNVQDCMDNGRAMVKDLARVFCPCGKNFVYASGNSPFFWSEGGNTTESVQTTTPQQTYDQRFRLTNRHKGTPLGNTPYRIVTDDGDELAGYTDEQGYTQRITANRATSATLHVLDETPPLNPEWDKYL